jgi:hypothetical protein
LPSGTRSPRFREKVLATESSLRVSVRFITAAYVYVYLKNIMNTPGPSPLLWRKVPAAQPTAGKRLVKDSLKKPHTIRYRCQSSLVTASAFADGILAKQEDGTIAHEVRETNNKLPDSICGRALACLAWLEQPPGEGHKDLFAASR